MVRLLYITVKKEFVKLSAAVEVKEQVCVQRKEVVDEKTCVR